MYRDKWVEQMRRSRSARGWSNHVVFDAWSGYGGGLARAAIAASEGDLVRAAAAAGGAWRLLLHGDAKGALDGARQDPSAPSMGLLEAHALLAMGAVRAGLTALSALAARGDGPATLSLIRELHKLGDHRGAVNAARRLPENVHAALIGARAALVLGRVSEAWNLLSPVFDGSLDAPDSATSAALCLVGASVLARSRQHEKLAAVAATLGGSADLPEEMWPATARLGWMAGSAEQAWNRFDVPGHRVAAAARAELAVLAARVDLARALLDEAGDMALPTRPAFSLLTGDVLRSEGILADIDPGARVHVWVTHAARWKPWVDSLCAKFPNRFVANLAAAKVPALDDLPDAVFDDGALVEILNPACVATTGPWTGPVHVSDVLCAGVGVGYDIPSEDVDLVRVALGARSTLDRSRASVLVCAPDEAYPRLNAGLPTVVVAPPGDPFWAGPLPARAWEAVAVVRRGPVKAWDELAASVLAALDRAGGSSS